MALRGRNNCLFYYSPLHTLGSKAEIQTALAIVRGYDLLVVGEHTGADLLLLNKIIEGAKEANSSLKVFGYVALGSVGSGAAKDAIDDWISNSPPSSGLIDGIFLDEFGHDFPSGTRDQQNAAVSYCHSLNLSAFANAWVPTDVFGTPPNNSNNATPVIGSNSNIKDYVLIESFITAVDGLSPVTTGDWTRDLGRLDYFISQRDNQNKNISVVAMMGAGLGTGLSANTGISESLYRQVYKSLVEVNCDFLCVNHGDLGAVSKTFFVQHVQNVFPTVVPSGTNELIKL